VIFDDIEVVKVILALIGCHTVVKHLKYDVYSYDYCVSITLRAAHLFDVDPSQSIFIQTTNLLIVTPDVACSIPFG
jgi:hypothetical protein